MVSSIVLRISAALAVALTAGAVLVATGASATATQGQPLVAGQYNDATSTTTIANTGSGDGLDSYGGGSGVGVYGQGGSGGGNGVQGYAGTFTATGVFGVNVFGGKGVSGASDATNGTGVYGEGNAAGGTGVYGIGGAFGVYGSGSVAGVYSTSSNIGVFGSGSVVGVSANSQVPGNTGIGLQVVGRSVFRTAGTAVISSGKKSVTVTLAGVTTSDFVLATVQGAGAFYVKNASAGSGQFTIFINKAPTSPATVTVAYFVISAS